MRTRREATRITCAGRVAATIVNTTASSAKTAELKGLPDCHASRLTDTSGTVSTPAIARSDGRHPALIATIAKPNAICQAIARERHSFEIAVSPARITSGAGISMTDAQRVPCRKSGALTHDVIRQFRVARQAVDVDWFQRRVLVFPVLRNPVEESR